MVSRLAGPKKSEQAIERAAVSVTVERQGITQENDVSPPGTHLNSGAECGNACRSLRLTARDSRLLTHHIMIGEKHGIKTGSGMPALVGGGAKARHQGAFHVMGEIGVTVKVHHTLAGRYPRE